MAYKIRLPDIINQEQLYYRFKEAMELRLKATIGPHIHDKISWDELVETAERFDSNLYASKRLTNKVLQKPNKTPTNTNNNSKNNTFN